MSEFRIHHDVNELLSLLRVRGGDGAEVYIDLLQKNRTPYVTTTVSAHSAKVGSALLLRRPGQAGPRPGVARAQVHKFLTEQPQRQHCRWQTVLLEGSSRTRPLLNSVLPLVAHTGSCYAPCCTDE